MKKLLAAIGICLVLAAPAAAEVKTFLVCDEKTLAANTTTDCTYKDISECKFFSYQITCAETTDNSMSIDVDWIGGSYAHSDYMGIPILASGSAMSQLQTAYSTETGWTVLETIQPPVSPVGTLRFTENNNDADIVCSAILNCGI